MANQKRKGRGKLRSIQLDADVDQRLNALRAREIRDGSGVTLRDIINDGLRAGLPWVRGAEPWLRRAARG